MSSEAIAATTTPAPETGPAAGAVIDTVGAVRSLLTVTVFADAVAAHNEVFGVLDDDEQKTLHDLLARIVEQGTGQPFRDDHSDI